MFADLDRMDALLFSEHPEDRAELARGTHETNPKAWDEWRVFELTRPRDEGNICG
jgi:hypothetical protein